MIVIKHTKIGAISYVSHIDLMRVLQRSLARAGVEVEYSEGYNPHPITFCSQPLPLGMKSECEYFVIANKTGECEEVLKKFNNNTPKGLQGIWAVKVDKNPNLVGKSVKCDYEVSAIGLEPIKNDLELLVGLKELDMTFKHKDEIKTQNIAGLIFSVEVAPNLLKFCLASGNVNLRADRFVEFINARFALKIDINGITRKVQYLDIGGKIETIDNYLEGVQI